MDECVHAAGLLGSTGITPLPCYYEPIRLPFQTPSRVMHSPRRLPLEAAAWAGLPGNVIVLLVCAHSSHSDRPNRCLRPLLPYWWQASHLLGAWPPVMV